MSDSIKVAIKVRPLIKREKDDNLTIQWQVQGNSIVSTDSEMKRRGDGGFYFDHIFDMDATNSSIFDTIVRPIVDAAVNGFNGTVFAYGQTSSGKTYTMMGTVEEPGIIPLAVEYMFDAISNTAGREFLLRVSYLEIYNEKVNDLLNKDGVDLKLHEDGSGQVIVKCKEEITNCAENVLCLMKKGDKNRRIGETNMNERSSRSHTIFRITIESREVGADSDGAIQVSQLNLVDLAGSERARQTGATGERFKEGRHINLSLSALSLVIMQLSESQDNQKHVNFRDSKLTRLLQASLGGNAMTAIICAVTPAAADETLCTLSFASRAKSVKNKPQINEVMSDAALLKRYAKQLAKLNAELDKLKNDNRIAEVEEMESKLLEKDRINQLLEQRIELLKTRIVSGDTSNEESFKCKSRRRRTWGGPGTFKQHLPPVFSITTTLPTIREISPEKSHRKSIIQSVNIMNQTFQTAFADFELELIESERNRDIRDDGSDSEDEMFITKRKYERHVKFNDDIFLDKPKGDSLDVTPEKRDASIQTPSSASPSTPKNVLREVIHHLRKDITELREFTTLEKQLMCTHGDEYQRLSLEKEQLEKQLQHVLGEKDLLEFTMEDADAHSKFNKSCNTEPQEILQTKQTLQDIPELKTHLMDFKFEEQDTLEHIITNLSSRLTEAEKQLSAKENMNLKKISDLEKQCQILKDNEEQSIIERTAYQKAKQKVLELEKQIDMLKDAEERNVIMKIAHEETLKKLSVLEKKSESLKIGLTPDVFDSDEHRRALRRISELEKQIETLKDTEELNKVMKTLKDIETQHASIKSAYEATLKEVSQLKKQIEVLNQTEQQHTNLKLVHEEALHKISQMETFIKDCETQNAANKLAYEEVLAKISESEAEVATLKVFEGESITVKAAHEEALQKISDLEKETQDLREQNVAIEAPYKEALEKISGLQAEVEDVKKGQHEKVLPEEQIGTRKNDEGSVGMKIIYDETSEKASELQTQTNASVQSAATEVAYKEASQNVSELEKQNKTLKGIEEQYTVTKIEYERALEKISKLEEQLEYTKNQCTSEKTVRHEALKSISELGENMVESQAGQLEKIAGEINLEKTVDDKTMRTIADLEAEINGLRSNNVQVLKVAPDIEAWRNMEDQLTEAKAARDELLGNVSEMKTQIERLVFEKDEFKHMIDDLRKELKEKIIELQGKSAELELPNDYNEIVESNNSLKKRVQDLQDLITTMQAENKELEEQLAEQPVASHAELSETNLDASYIIMTLEDDKSKLAMDLEMKVQELQEIKNDVQSLKSDIEKLQKTIYLLTTENMEMSTKLSAEKSRSKEAENNLQRTIDELYARISEVTDEKNNLESDLLILNEQLESARSKVPDPYNDEEHMLFQYQEKINKLAAENIELTSIIAEKNEELITVKESKSLLYDHECIYRDKVAALTERIQCLVSENNELSTDLIDKIEENDSLKEECGMLKNKLEMALTNNVISSANDVEQLKIENNNLRAEVMELKMKVNMLSNENEKFSNNLLEAMEDLNNSRTERSCNNTLHLSGILDASMKLDETGNDILCEENREALINKVIVMQDKINHITRLNKKLSELKLLPCNQCAHLKHLYESRRALKLEAKVLNHKLEDLQKKFDRKCAETEALKVRASQELNISLNDTTLNASFTDGMTVSYVEEKIQQLNNELQMLKEDHDKLSWLYQEKCNELEELHDITGPNANEEESKSKRQHTGESGNKVEEVQKSIHQLRDDIAELKKKITNLASVLKNFENEKAGFIDEINMLKNTNEELMQKMSENEILAASSIERSQILENEVTSLTKEIEECATREKTVISEKLTLEVEFEGLKAEKNDVILKLHKTIDELNDCLSSVKNELDAMKHERDELQKSAASIERKYNEEVEAIKKQCLELQNEKVRSIEAEKRAALRSDALQADIEKLRSDLMKQDEYLRRISELEVLSKESDNEKAMLRENVAALELKLSQSTNGKEAVYKEELDSVKEKFEIYMKVAENELKRANEKFRKYIEENEDLGREVAKLRNIERMYKRMKNEMEEKSEGESTAIHNEKLTHELASAKQCIINELKSLKWKVTQADLINKSVEEIFVIFLQALMAKEEEIVKKMRDQFEREKQKLEDDKRQTADAEKRVTSWAKELETEIEKLQADLAHRENLNGKHEEKISQLQHSLKEITNEKEMLREKLDNLESEFSNLQAEFDRRDKVDIRQEAAISIAQRKEKEAQEVFRKMEMELQSKIKSEKETYEERIKELVSTIEIYKTKNMELQNNIEGLEAAEKQLKNIIEANTIELRRKDQRIQRMSVEIEQLSEAYNEVNRDVEERNTKIEEITALLKSKCDMLLEYKAKLETIGPNYELLKEQVKERKANIERCQDEIEALKRDKEEQIQMIQEKLNSEEVKTVGLSKQLNELHNKNVALVEELQGLKEKYEALQQENAKLERKIRNSTSKIKAETEIEELKDINKRLHNNLDGASNRIAEVQESKNQLQKELLSLKSQHVLLVRENEELKNAVALYKSKESATNFLANDDQYNALLQEKNKIALELEGKKLLLNQREREIEKSLAQIEELTKQNKELDSELDDYAGIIRERDAEISKMEDKLYSNLAENSAIKELEDRIKVLVEQKDEQETQLRKLKLHMYTEKEQLDRLKSQNEKLSGDLKLLHLLKQENSELQAKVNDLENKLESRSNSSSSRCTSPAFETSRRKLSRNELFNQRRQLESLAMNMDSNETEESLRNKIRDLELQLVAKIGKIATLEMQIQSENFPYQRKCKDLGEQLLAFRNKNTELRSEIKKLQRAVNDINALHCETCSRWRINKRDQECQTIKQDRVVRFCGTSSGIVDDHILIKKLERERNIARDLCHSLTRQVKTLQKRNTELENAESVQQAQNPQNASVLRPIDDPQSRSNQQSSPFMQSNRLKFEKNSKSATKENVPTNLLEATRFSKQIGRVRNNNL